MQHSKAPHYLCQLHALHLLLNPEYKPIAKECYRCHRMQTLDSYYNDKTGILGRATACAECRRVSSKQFRADNSDYYRKYQLAHREHLVAYQKQWALDNADRSQSYTARSQAKRQLALANCLPDNTDYLQQVTATNYCEITGVTTELELDHIMPITKGNWGNTEGNLMKLSQSLNSSKGNKNVFSWIAEMEQERLEYLIDESWTVEQFGHKFEQVLTVKAAEKGLSFTEYKEQYEEEYGR